MHSNKEQQPEAVPASERHEMVSLATLGRLTGYLIPKNGILCLHCPELAICRIGSGVTWSVCEKHANGADRIQPL